MDLPEHKEKVNISEQYNEEMCFITFISYFIILLTFYFQGIQVEPSTFNLNIVYEASKYKNDINVSIRHHCCEHTRVTHMNSNRNI